jgi:hypothetical protein
MNSSKVGTTEVFFRVVFGMPRDQLEFEKAIPPRGKSWRKNGGPSGRSGKTWVPSKRDLLRRMSERDPKLAQEMAQRPVQRFSLPFSCKVPRKRTVTWETIFLRESQRFAEEDSAERTKPTPFGFELPLPNLQPEILGDGDLTARIVGLSGPEARKLRIPKTTLWYQQKRLGAGVPVRIYRKVATRYATRVANGSDVNPNAG